MTAVTWNTSHVIGPRQIPTYGTADHLTGEREFLGWMPGFRLIVAASAMTEAAMPYLSSPQPANPQNRFAGDELGEDGLWKLGRYLVFPDGDDGEAAAALPDLCTVPAPPPEDPPEEGGEP